MTGTSLMNIFYQQVCGGGAAFSLWLALSRSRRALHGTGRGPDGVGVNPGTTDYRLPTTVSHEAPRRTRAPHPPRVGLSRVSPECPQSVPRVSSECPQSVRRVSSECPQSVRRVSPECPQSVLRVSSED
uniref:Secreted protein n=1 Tax=Knipowitschia caucasica TaxID=637954 RepID=A0AAV2KNI3_KNICA